MLRVFFGEASDGQALPGELRGLSDAAQNGPPGIRRTLVLEGQGERLRIEVTAVGKGRTQLHLWREPLPEPVSARGGAAAGAGRWADAARA